MLPDSVDEHSAREAIGRIGDPFGESQSSACRVGLRVRCDRRWLSSEDGEECRIDFIGFALRAASRQDKGIWCVGTDFADAHAVVLPRLATLVLFELLAQGFEFLDKCRIESLDARACNRLLQILGLFCRVGRQSLSAESGT